MSNLSNAIKLDHDDFFREYHLDLSFPPPPRAKALNFFEKTWHKIVRFFKRFIKTLCFWKRDTKFKLTTRQIALIKQQEESPPIESARRAEGTLFSLQRRNSKEDGISLNKFSEYIKTFAQYSEKILTENILKPSISSWKQSLLESLDQVKTWIEVIANIKKAISPVLGQMHAVGDPIFMILLQQLLQVLLPRRTNGQNCETSVKRSLVHKLKSLKLKREITSDQYTQLLSYVDRLLKWLFSANNWLIYSDHPLLLHQFIMDSLHFFDVLADLSEKGELDQILAKMKEQIETSFEQDFKGLIQLNSKPLTKKITNRLSQLVETLDFNTLTNAFLDILIQQMDGICFANKRQSEWRVILSHAENDALQRAKNLREVQKQQVAQNLLKEVKNVGKKGYLSRKYLKSFSRAKGCHPVVQSLIQTPTQREKNKIEDNFYEKIADTLLVYLFPPKNVKLPDGTPVKISGIAKIIDHLKYPTNMQWLIEEGWQVIHRVIDLGEFKNKDNFYRYFTAVKEILQTQILYHRLKGMIKEGIKQLINRVTSEDFLKKTLNENLPLLIEKTFLNFQALTIQKNLTVLSPLFQRAIAAEDLADEREIGEVLYHLMQKQMRDFQMEKAGITKQNFIRLTQPLIVDILEHLIKKLTERGKRELSLQEIKRECNHFLAAGRTTPNERYYTLLRKALFQIANFKIPGLENGLLKLFGLNTEGVFRKYKKVIINGVGEALKNISFHQMLNKKGERPTHRPLRENLHLFASLLHDRLYRTIESERCGHLLKRYTPTTAMIDQTISTIFQQLFTNKTLNKNLLFRVLSVFDETLKSAIVP